MDTNVLPKIPPVWKPAQLRGEDVRAVISQVFCLLPTQMEKIAFTQDCSEDLN